MNRVANSYLLLMMALMPFVETHAQPTTIIDSLKRVLAVAADDSFKVHLLTELSWYYANSDVNESKKFAIQAIEVARQAESDDMLSDAYNSLGLAFDYEGVPDSLTKYFLLSLRLKEGLGDKNGAANVLNNIGVSHYYRGGYDSSMVYFMKALNIREEMGDSLRIAQSFNNIGLLYRTQENFGKAKEFYLRSAAIKEQFDDQKSLLNTYNNLSAICQKQKAHDSAFFYAQKVLDIATELNDSSEMAGAFGNIGMSHFEKGEFAESVGFLKKAADIFRTTDKYQMLPISLNRLAAAYAKTGKHDQAISSYAESLSLSEKQELAEEQLTGLKGLSEALDATGKPKEALAYFQRYHELNKEAFNLEKAKVIENLNTKYETEKKEREIALLNAENEKNEAEIESKNAQRNLFVGLSLAAVILLMVGGFFYGRIRSKNQQIEVALEEKGVLLKEIHHRVKNNLQMISSLLNLQSRYVHDEQASKALKDSRNRVASVSLIHQRLYQEDNLKGVLMKEYIPQLVDELMATTDTDGFEVKLNIQNLNLDIDTVIPLGLVMNELITNVLKYATASEQNLLELSLSEKGEELILSVKDSGPGVPEDFNPNNTTSYGVKLIRSLSRKLDASVDYINLKPGLEVRMTIKNYKHAA